MMAPLANRIDHMQNSAPSWITGVRHLESSFASFATTRSRSTCTCTSIHILAKFVPGSCESLDIFLVRFAVALSGIASSDAVQMVWLDTSRQMATNMCECSLCWGREGRSDLRALHLMSRATRRRRALVLVAVGASQGWTASLLSLPALEHHLVGLGVLVNVDRHASGVEGTFAHSYLWFNAGLPASSLRACLSWLSTITPASLSLSPSFHLTTHRSAQRKLRILETVLENTVWSRHVDRQLLFQDVVGVHVLVACSFAETSHLFSFRGFSVLPQFNHLLLLRIHTVTSSVGGVPRLKGWAVRQTNLGKPQPRQVRKLAVAV